MDPRSLAHVGVAVPDLEEAVEWYREVLGWTMQTEPRTVRGGDGYAGTRAVDVLGEFEEMTVVTLRTGNGVGIEVFEFSPAGPRDGRDAPHQGYFHVCVTDPDVEGLAASIDDRDGDHHAKIWRLYEDDEEYRLTYCRDPYGNLIEIYSHDQERMHDPSWSSGRTE
jgi:catechol 2,3-dioxygenase-like lactoylglutathione lyase family enzyme